MDRIGLEGYWPNPGKWHKLRRGFLAGALFYVLYDSDWGFSCSYSIDADQVSTSDLRWGINLLVIPSDFRILIGLTFARNIHLLALVFLDCYLPRQPTPAHCRDVVACHVDSFIFWGVVNGIVHWAIIGTPPLTLQYAGRKVISEDCTEKLPSVVLGLRCWLPTTMS